MGICALKLGCGVARLHKCTYATILYALNTDCAHGIQGSSKQIVKRGALLICLFNVRVIYFKRMQI